MNRRTATRLLAGASLATATRARADSKSPEEPFAFDYVLASALYGDMELATILPEVARAGAVGLDIWGKPHGTQREELGKIGAEAFAALLEEHGAKLRVSTRYPLGPFGLRAEMPILKRLGGKVLVCGTTGPKDPVGEAAKKAVRSFLEKMKPHADVAGEHGLVIAVENHSSQLLSHPDSLRYFAEFNDHRALGVAFAPHHLHGFPDQIPALIRELGKDNLPFFYFQEYGIGSKKQVEKKVELEQLPGRGKMDWRPVVQALKEAQFAGVAEIFMHPTPRGVPMLETATAITDTINESRKYIEQCLVESK